MKTTMIVVIGPTFAVPQPMTLSLLTPGQYFSLSMNQVDGALDGGMLMEG